MNVLKANLRLYYQRRSLWLWYAMVISLFVLSLASFQNFFLLVLAVGAIAADMQRDVLTRPFSFLLPGHHETHRRLLVSLGSALSLLIAAGFVVVHRFPFPSLGPYFLATTAVAVMFYFAGVFLGLSKFASAIGIIWMLSVMIVTEPGYGTVIERTITHFPLWVLMAGILAFRRSWRSLGDRSLERKLCGKFILGMGFNHGKMMEYARRNRKGARTIEPVADWFVSQIRASAPYGRTRVLIGSFYARFGSSFSLYLLFFPLMIIGLSAFLGYTVDSQWLNYGMFFGLLLALSQSGLLTHPTLLIPGGRAEKFHSAALMGLFLMLLILLCVMLIVLLTVPLASILPAITIKSRIYPFHAFSVRNQNVYLLAAVLPISMLFGTVFQRKNVPAAIVVMAIAASLLVVHFRALLAPLVFPTTIYGKLNLVAATWTSCLAALYYHCHRRNLV